MEEVAEFADLLHADVDPKNTERERERAPFCCYVLVGFFLIFFCVRTWNLTNGGYGGGSYGGGYGGGGYGGGYDKGYGGGGGGGGYGDYGNRGGCLT